MIRGVARKIGNWKEWHNRRIELRWTNVPVCKLAILAGNKGIVETSGKQRIDTGDTRRILLKLVLGNPLVRVNEGPGVQAFGTLPIHRPLVGGECSRRTGKVANVSHLL